MSESDQNKPPAVAERMEAVVKFLDQNYLLVGMFVMILVAFAYPDLGESNGPLKTNYSVGYGVNCSVFVLSGLSMKTESLVDALVDLKLNLCIQSFVFGITPLLFYLIYLALRDVVQTDLIEGYCMLGCLPMTINMCYVLTSSGKGNASAALFNATLGNIIGVFISPLLIFGMLSIQGGVSYAEVLTKLTYKVVIPLIFGQILLNLPHAGLQGLLKKSKPYYKRTQESLLTFVVWASFCNTFYNKVEIAGLDVFLVVLLVIGTQLLVYSIVWVFFGLPCMGFKKSDRVAGLFCSSAKTLALGLPLLTSMNEANPGLGTLCIPLLIYHPCLIVFGSLFVPQLKKWVEIDEDDEVENGGNREVGEGGEGESSQLQEKKEKEKGGVGDIISNSNSVEVEYEKVDRGTEEEEIELAVRE